MLKGHRWRRLNFRYGLVIVERGVFIRHVAIKVIRSDKVDPANLARWHFYNKLLGQIHSYTFHLLLLLLLLLLLQSSSSSSPPPAPLFLPHRTEDTTIFSVAPRRGQSHSKRQMLALSFPNEARIRTKLISAGRKPLYLKWRSILRIRNLYLNCRQYYSFGK